MLSLKENPAGIDWYIQQLQVKLHDKLIDAKYLALPVSTQYKAYGRCYRNKTDDGYIAENYEGGDEYREVYFDDTVSLLSFFGLSSKIGPNEADVHLIFFANLGKLLLEDRFGAQVPHRADEELREMVRKIIGQYSFGFSYVSTELWLENVLREYPGSRRDDRLIRVDMHPLHCFRINLKLIFNPNKVC